MQKENKQGFTLIEILVVVAIILVLAGILFRIGNLVSDRAKRAKAIADMQQIANALEEYYAVFRFYPPVNGMNYTYADPGKRPDRIKGISWDKDHEDGLCAYLYGREPLDPKIDEQIPDDLKKRMAVYVGGMASGGSQYATNSIPGEGFFEYSNSVKKITSPWGNSYGYETQPPFLSYELYTSVPNSDERLTVSSGGQ